MKKNENHFVSYAFNPVIWGLMCLISISFSKELHSAQLTISGVDSQQVEGWGVMIWSHNSVWGNSNGGADGTWPHEIHNRPGIMNVIYNELNVSHIRLELHPNYHTSTKSDKLSRWDHDGDSSTPKVRRIDDLRDAILAAKQYNPQIKWYLSIWSPPALMKSPQSINGLSSGTPTEIINTSANHEAFAKWVVAAMQYLESEGCGRPEAVSPLNEPGHDVTYAGVGEIGHGQIQAIANTFRSEFDYAGFNTVSVIVTEGNHYGVTLTQTANQDGWMWRFNNDNIHDSAIVGTHSYDYWASNSALSNLLDRYRVGQNSTSNRKHWMTEWNPDGSEQYSDVENKVPVSQMQMAFTSTRHFLREMMQFDFTLWTWWVAWNYTPNFKGDRLLYGEVQNFTSNAPAKSKWFHVISTIWKHAPAGSYVRKVDSDSSYFADDADPVNNGERGIDVGAFRRNDGQMVLVVVNDSASDRFMNLLGLTGTQANVYEVSSSKNASNVANLTVSESGTASYTFPKKSISILVCNEGEYSGEYKITSAYNGRSIETQYWSISNGGNLAMHDFQGQNNQKWLVTPVGGDFYKVVNKHSGKAADVSGWSNSNGANIHQWDSHGGSNQQWKFQEVGDGYIYLVNKNSGKCMDIQNWTYGNGGNVQQYTIQNQNNNKWLVSSP